MTTLLVIQHAAHEGLGTFEAAFRAAGCALAAVRADEATSAWPALRDVHGLVIMGGPQSVYEQKRHPYLAKELAMLRQAVAKDLPVLGICLGSQLLAAALGATVTKNPQKEIGWYPLMREPDAETDPLWEPFGQTETVFQWHGDTFALPRGAVRLASSPLCAEQAFRYGEHAWGLQFHAEMTEAMVRAWLAAPVNRAELASVRGAIDPATIRRQSLRHIGRLQELARHVATTFARTCHTMASARA